MKFTYYPGCSLETTAKEYDMSTRAVFKALDIELSELGDWNCCGASAVSSTDHLLSLSLAARNLAMSENQALDLMAPCPECYLKHWQACESIKADTEVLDTVNRTLKGTGLKLEGSIDVKHPLYIMVNDLGLEKLGEKVVKPLDGLKVVPYYGCVMLKPPRADRLDSAENPTGLDKVITAVGAEVAPFESKVKCCGGGLMLTNMEVMMKLTHGLLKEARDTGADCIITACPLCHMSLDARQIDIEKKYNEKIGLPVLYFTQLIGLAFGIEPKKLGLNKNFVSADKLLKSLEM